MSLGPSFSTHLYTILVLMVRQAALFETELHRPFVSVDIVNRKHLNDEQRRPSVFGLITCKAEQVCLKGACIFIDDQYRLLEEVEELQAQRAEGNRRVCRRAEPYANSSLFKLASLLKHKGPEAPPKSAYQRFLQVTFW